MKRFEPYQVETSYGTLSPAMRKISTRHYKYRGLSLTIIGRIWSLNAWNIAVLGIGWRLRVDWVSREELVAGGPVGRIPVCPLNS